MLCYREISRRQKAKVRSSTSSKEAKEINLFSDGRVSEIVKSARLANER